MPLRKAKFKEQMNAVLREQLQPGEQVEAEGFCEGGPSPYLVAWWSPLARIMLTKPYYVAVTPSRVIWLRASQWTGRPRGLLRIDQRDQVGVEKGRTGVLWNPFVYRAPDGSRKKLRYGRIWREEMGAVLQALGALASTQA